MSAALMTRAMRCSALASSSPSSSSRRHAAGPALPASSGCASMRSLRRSGSNSNAFVASSSSTTNRRSLRPVAALATDGKPAVVKVAEKIGLEPSEGIFGFTPFAELWVGRLAMAGFLVSIIMEGSTGKGTLAQLGFDVPSPALLNAFLVTFGGLTAASTIRTLYEAATGKMTKEEALRYGNFFGVKPSDVKAAESAASAMKAADDYSLPGRDVAAIEAARLAKASPADAVLGKDDDAAIAATAQQLRAEVSSASSSPLVGGTISGDSKAADDAADALKRASSSAPAPSVSLASRADAVETFAGAGDASARYARDIERSQGRWAMAGFFLACAIEAYNGHGILGQLIDWFKFVGLLGEASGF